MKKDDIEEESQEGNSVSKLDGVCDEREDHEPDIVCGIGKFRPRWLQRLASPKAFLLNHSFVGIFQGAHFAYIIGCLSTLEKRYTYDSKMTAAVIIAGELTPLFCGPFVGYFGGKTHRPRFLCVVSMIATLSCFMMGFPYLLYGPAEHLIEIAPLDSNKTKSEICDLEEKSQTCKKDPNMVAIAFLLVGHFVKGFTGQASYIISSSYMDDSVKKKNSPLYFGILMALRMLGPVLGFLLSSLCLKYYENPFVDPGFDQKDPRWIGAWWLGFVILGVATFIFGLPLALFPRDFRKRSDRLTVVKKKTKCLIGPILLKQIKDMKDLLVRLMKNPVYMFHLFGTVFYLNGVEGYFIYMPKYMEEQFRKSASEASLLSGPISVASIQLGAFLGGLAIRKFKPRPRLLAGYMILVDLVSVVGIIICMCLTCPLIQMTGTTLQSDQRTLQLENTCNMDCRCTTNVYTPVCGPDGVSTYFSPCYAGCTEVNKTGDDKEEYIGCKCVHDQLGEFIEGDVQNGYCKAECGYMTLYIAVLSAGKLIASTARVGSMMIFLRCVAPEDKSAGLGIMDASLSLFAFIPNPLIYGALMDMACLVWEKSCGVTGNCWVYDIDKFRYFLHGMTSSAIFIGALLNVFMCIYIIRIKDFYDDDDQDKEERDGEEVDKKYSDRTEMVTLKHQET